MPDKAIIRITIAAMILLVALPSLLGNGQELHRHFAAGGGAAAVLMKLAITMICGGLVLIASIIVARGVRVILLSSRGSETPAAVTQVQPQRDGAWKVTYEYRDRGGESHQGVFYADSNIWREGDRGPVRYDLNAPAQSTWVGPAPDRPPGPSVVAADTQKPISQFRRAVMSVACLLSVCAVYVFWNVIWRDGGGGTFGPWQNAALLACVFVVMLPFAAGAAFVVVAAGFIPWMCLAVVRRALRD